MKATLEFNLPEDREEYEMHTQASDLYLAISDLQSMIRQIDRYEDKREISIETIRKKFWETLRERKVDHFF
jgi:hypothetical protein